MHSTYSAFAILQPDRHARRPQLTAVADPHPSRTSVNFSIDTRSTETIGFNPTRRTGSTVWGPGAIAGKVLKRFGEGVHRSVVNVAIHTQLNKISAMQPTLLGSTTLTPEEKIEMQDQCEKLVELCIVGLNYPPKFMRRALDLILSGFEQPGRKIWSQAIAMAISQRQEIDVFEIFRDCFFALLDDSIFQIDGVVVLETLSFRCPAVAHEIATIISYLACRDRDPSVDSNVGSNFSSVIINAGFFRLVERWAKRGLLYWDQRGVESLECALKDVAEAQASKDDPERNAEYARELMRQLQGRRLLLGDVY